MKDSEYSSAIRQEEKMKRLESINADLLEACKKLILHKNQGDIHPIDYQRIEQAIAKAEDKS
jgi:hypothetical protein